MMTVATTAASPDPEVLSGTVTAARRPAMGDPGPSGRFGPYGGRVVPQAPVPACEQLEEAFRAAWADRGFRAELAGALRGYAGRPTPVTEAARLSAELCVRVLLKPAHLGLDCVVYMGERDMERQELNVFRMELLGATVVPVTSGSRTLKDATSEAFRHWVTTVDSAHYCIGSGMGPHPYPWMVREFQRVVGDEARAQCGDLLPDAVPDVVVACVGGGSNAASTFAGFAATMARLVGVEAAGGAAGR